MPSLSKENNGAVKVDKNSNKTRRGHKGKHKIQNQFKLVGVNANGISSKFQSLDYIISEINPSVVCIQETKVKTVGKIKSKNSNNYTIFELVRKQSRGGGLAILVKPDLNPVWISEGDDVTEMLVVEVHIKELSIRIINCYGPQETDSIERKTLFWSRLQTEVNEAIDNNIAVIVQMDGNLHAGEQVIKGDPNKMNANGKLFSTFLDNNPSMVLVNSSDKCQGVITRQRTKGDKVEQAVLDYALVCNTLEPYLESMIIDEDRKYSLTSYLNGKMKNSDHFTEILTFDIDFKRQKPDRKEHFNFKNEECQRIFTEILNTENNLQKCFQESDDIDTQVENWFKELNKIFHRSFKKIRTNMKKIRETETSILLRRRSEIIQKIKKDSNNEDYKHELDDVIAELTKMVSKENRDKIFETFKALDQSERENFASNIWEIKKKEFPKVSTSVPSAKTDVNGRIVTDPNGIKKLYLETFTHRLRQRPIKEDFSDLFKLQQDLCRKRLINTLKEKSQEWSEKEVVETLKSLKNNKCSDPLGFVNEIFKPPVAGSDLVKSIKIMMNRIKDEVKVPELFRLKNISTIYKNKGSKSNLENDRGIFTSTVLNTILQKLIYGSIYEEVDSNLSDSNIGARKRKSIRNHTFIINGIINDTIATKKTNVDLAIMDYKTCFDAMSVDVTINDLYSVGVKNDLLNLINQCDARSSIAVKTPVGLTDRIDIMKIVAQGEVNSPLKCTVTVDNIAQQHTENLEEYLYKYKDKVPMPPLTFVDDTIGVSLCGTDSALTTAHLNAQTNMKKLQYGAQKCNKMHIGDNKVICPKNTIDTWIMEKETDTVESILEMVDKEGEMHEMETVSSSKYLGDVLQSNGRNDLNIKERITRGYAANNQIMMMLEDLTLGDYYFEAANILRNALLLSSLLSNCDAWYNVTKKEISCLESVDETLHRKIFAAHSKTPLELLYLESGNIPIRFILKSRRLNYLWYILHEDDNALLKTVFQAQCDKPVAGDWVKTVQEDMKDIELNMSFADIQKQSKDSFQTLVKNKVKTAAFTYLTKLQTTHSKSKQNQYNCLELQTYLKPGNNMTIQEKCFAFQARSRCIPVKCNFKIGLSDLKCRQCGTEDETQEHLMTCLALSDHSLTHQNTPEYSDIFSDDPKKIRIVARILQSKLKMLTNNLNNPCAHNSSAALDNNVNLLSNDLD